MKASFKFYFHNKETYITLNLNNNQFRKLHNSININSIMKKTICTKRMQHI